MATVELTCEELASTNLSDDVISISTSHSTIPEPPNSAIDSNESASELENDMLGEEVWGRHEDNRPPLEEINERVKLAWKDRHEASRYAQVVVLLISWEEHDLGQEVQDAIYQYTLMFKHLYKYEVWHFKIPSKKPRLALASELVALAEKDSPHSLFIIWYDGHGLEHEDRRGPPRWCSHQDPELCRTVDSSIISATLSDCEADILLVNNACMSLTCDRFNSKGIVESISASAFNTATYGSMKPDDLSPSMTWAALKILRDKKCVEKGITVAELHRRICLAVQWGNEEHPEIDNDQVRWETPNIRTQPVYTRLSAHSAAGRGRTRSIVLGQLKTPGWCSDSISRPDMQVQLKVDYPDRIDPKEWIDWLLSAPRCVNFLRLDVNDEEFCQDGNFETSE